MKKVLALILALVMALSLVACSKGGNDKPDDNETKKVKVGFITLHDENSTYDLNFINAAKEACQTLGLVENEDYFIKKNVPEGQECYNAAAELAEQGCNIIFADSFGHESYMIEAAKEFKNVQFCPTATMEVTFTGSWYDETAEKEGAEKLIQNGCVLISQHADSMGAPTACEKAGVPNVSYNGSTVSVGPNTYIISSRID